jgi:putative membrane protein
MEGTEVNSIAPRRPDTPQRRRGLVGWVVGGLLIALLIGVFVVPFLFWGTSTMGPYGYYPRAWFFFPFGFLIFFFVIFFVVRALFWGWGWGWRGGYGRGYWGRSGYWGDASEILKQRYARGEITKDQFDQMMRDLKAHDA